MTFTCEDPSGFERRSERIRQLSVGVLSELPEACLSLLGSLVSPVTQQVQDAAVVLHLCQLYADCWTNDRILEHCARLLPSVPRSELSENLVRPVRLNFLLCNLGLARYWDIRRCALEVLQHYLELRLLDGATPDELVSELHERWNVAKAASALVQKAQARLSLPPAPRFVDHVPQDDEESLNALDMVMPLARARVSSQSLGEIDDQDLTGVVVDFHVAIAVQEMLELKGVQNQRVCAVLDERADLFLSEVRQWMRGLSAEESHCFLPVTREVQHLQECLAAGPVMHLNKEGEIGPPTEIVDGIVRPPGWLIDNVFSMGGRFGHESLGPIPYLWIVFEPNELQARPDKIGLRLSQSTEEFIIHVHVLDDDTDPVVSTFHFLLESARNMHTLALISQCRGFRLDLLEVDDGGASWNLIRSIFVRMHGEDLSTVVETASSRILEMCPDPKAFREVLQGDDHSEPWIAFAMSESSKDEQLRLRIPDLSQLPPETEMNADWEQLSDLMEHWLACEEERLSLDENDVRTREIVNVQTDTRMNVRLLQQRLRGRDAEVYESVFTRPSPELSAATLGPAEEGFVHFNIRAERLELHGMVYGKPQPAYERIVLSGCDLNTAVDLSNDWLSAEVPNDRIQALQQLLDLLSHSIGDALAEFGSRNQLRHLTISPCWLLEMWPLHCLRASNGVLLADQFQTISYCPSLTHLARLKKRGPVPLDRFVGVGFETACANIEIETVATCFEDARKLLDGTASAAGLCDAAKGASIIHVAAHGSWDPVDPMRSSLHLAESDLRPIDVMKSRSFEGVGLVFLATCFSGRFFQSFRDFKDFLGLDSIFLSAGVRSTVSTMWEVDDLVTLLLVTTFYDQLCDGRTVRDALAEATRLIRTGYDDSVPTPFDSIVPNWRDQLESAGIEVSDPHFWGAFRCSGWTAMSWVKSG